MTATRKITPKPAEKGICKRGHMGPLGANCGDCLMDHVEIAAFEKVSHWTLLRVRPQ